MNDLYGNTISLGLKVAVADVWDGHPYLHVGRVVEKDVDHQRVRVEYDNKVVSTWIDCLSFGYRRIIVID